MLWAELPGRLDLAPVRTRARAAGIVFGAAVLLVVTLVQKVRGK
jgi:hypothetical protein